MGHADQGLVTSAVVISDQWKGRDSGTVGTAREDSGLLFIGESASAPLKHPQEAAGPGGGDLGVCVTEEPTKREHTRLSASRL